MFHEVSKVKHATLTLNLLLLRVIAVIPYPTGVIGRYGALRSAVVLSEIDRKVRRWLGFVATRVTVSRNHWIRTAR